MGRPAGLLGLLAAVLEISGLPAALLLAAVIAGILSP